MKKKATLLLLVFVMITTLSGCGIATAAKTDPVHISEITLNGPTKIADLAKGSRIRLNYDFTSHSYGLLKVHLHDGENIISETVYGYGAAESNNEVSLIHLGNRIQVALGETSFIFSDEEGFSNTVGIYFEHPNASMENVHSLELPFFMNLFNPITYPFSASSDDAATLVIIFVAILHHIPALLSLLFYYHYCSENFTPKTRFGWFDSLFILPCFLIPVMQFLYQSRPGLAQYIADIFNGLFGYGYKLTFIDLSSASDAGLWRYACYLAPVLGILLLLRRMIFEPAPGGVIQTIPAMLLGGLISLPMILCIYLWFIPTVVVLVIGFFVMGHMSSPSSSDTKAPDAPFYDTVTMLDDQGHAHTVLLYKDDHHAELTTMRGERIRLSHDGGNTYRGDDGKSYRL